MLRRALSILLLTLLAAAPAFAHEGEDHGAKAAGDAPPLAATASYVASSARHELVVSAPELTPLAESQLELYVNEWATNAPIEGAVVKLEFRPRSGGSAAAKAVAAATTQPGVYRAEFHSPAAGAYNVVVSLQSPLGADEFALSGFVVSATRAAPKARARGPLLFIGIGALVALLLVLAIARFGPRRAGTVGVLLAMLLTPAVRAHEGEDHGAPVVAASAGGEVQLAKASQFLLGIRTEIASPQPLSRQLALIGHVAPRGGAEVELVAPQAGRVYFGRGGSPTLGAPVTRGRTLATLIIVDSLALRSPLTGVVTAVHVADGQRVEAGQKLLSLLDPSVVWVHADVFGRDLGLLEQASRASITNEGYPGVVFPGRRLSLGASTGDVPGAVEIWFEVPNPGARLRVGLPVQVSVPIGGEEPLVLLPPDALLDRSGGARVFLHTAPERFASRAVTVVSRYGDRVAVRGLNAGERVVVRGASGLLGATPVAGK